MCKIFVTGLSCAGKTTFSRRLKTHLPGHKVISLDDYYFESATNWDDPSSFDFERLLSDIKDCDNFILEGICLPWFLMQQPPSNVVVIYIHIGYQEALRRRLQRSSTFVGEGHYFRRTVFPAHVRYCLTCLPQLKQKVMFLNQKDVYNFEIRV